MAHGLAWFLTLTRRNQERPWAITNQILKNLQKNRSCFMGQKANPISLRLKKTNQSFNSCWYSDTYYSKLLSQEFRAKRYLIDIFNQIKYPHPHLSFSLLPKRIRGMAIYLNPIESRRRRCERFQLKLIQGTSSIASDGSRRTDSQYRRDLLLSDIGPRGGPTSIFTNQPLLPTAIDVCPLGNAAREKRFFVHRLLLSIAVCKGSGEKLAWRKDFELFQKLHRLTWFQGREENSSFLFNKQQLHAWRSQAHTSDPRLEYRHKKIELANCNLNLSKISQERKVKMEKDSLATLRDRFPYTLRTTTYNTTQSLQNLRSTKVISGNNTNGKKREFSTFFNSRVFAPSSSLLSTAVAWRSQAPADQRSAIFRWAQDGHRNWESVVLLENLACQVRSNTTDSHQMSTRTASDGVSVWRSVQRGHPRHQQDLYPKLPIPRRDHIYVSLLESIIEKKVGCSISLCFYKSTEDGQAASFLSQEIAYYLERRVPFRRIKQLLLRELRTDYIEGVRINCSGRVGGRSKKAQRARGERFQWGETSSHVFSSRLSFASRSALTSFGKVGIKVWICYK